MAIIEGTGIVAAGKEARAKALTRAKQVQSDKKIAAEYKVDPIDKMIKDIDRNFKRLGSQESTGAVKETGRGMGDRFNPFADRADASSEIRKTNFFSPDGGAVDSRNNVKIASADIEGLDVGDSFTRQVSTNIKDNSLYKKEDNIYRPKDSIYDKLEGLTFPKIEKDTGYGESLEKGMDNIDRFDRRYYGVDEATKEYGVPMSKEEKRVTTAYTLSNQDDSYKDKYKFSDTNYAKIQSDYDKYKDLRDRRQTRKQAEEAVTKFRSDAMADFERADYAIRMTQYNPDGTEKDINKYNRTLDQQIDDLKLVNRANERLVDMSGRYPNLYKENLQDDGLYGLSRFGRVLPQSEINAYEKKVAAEEAERIRLSKLKAKSDYEESQKNVLQKVGDFIGRVTRPPAALGSENSISRTVPSGSFGISQEGKDQAAINKGIKAAEATGIPSGVAAQGGVTTQAARDAGVKARQQAADTRAKNMSEAQGIAARNPNVSIVGGKAVAANDSAKARAQAAAVNRKIQGKTVSQVKAENKKKMQDAAKKRNEAFKKSKAQKKKSGGGFGKSTTKKSAPKKSAPKKSAPKKSAPKKSAPSTNKRAQAAAKRRASQAKAKKSKSKSTKSKSSKSKSSKSGPGSSRGKAAAKGRTRRGGRGRSRCDIRCKYNIMPLTNMNLIRDDLAEVAYFVKELQA